MKVAIYIFALLVSFPASAQQHTPVRDYNYVQKLSEISNILGRAHAIRIRCNGRTDQYWRDYMSELIDIEAPDSGRLRASLIDLFNLAYSEEIDRYSYCSDYAIEAEQGYARMGQAIADQLAGYYMGQNTSSENNQLVPQQGQ